jgi:tetratricopeptide (TPR) repeat protein
MKSGLKRLIGQTSAVCLLAVILLPGELLALDKDPVRKWFNKGKGCYFQRRFSEAERYFRRCLKEVPTSAEYRCWLAQTISYILEEQALRGASKLSLLSEGQAIRTLYIEAMELNPRSWRARLGYAIILRDVPGWLGGDLDEAETILRGILQESPDNIFALHHLGTLYIRKRGEYQRGIKYLKHVLQVAEKKALDPEEKMRLPHTYHALGRTYYDHLEKPATAVHYLEKATSIDPFSPRTLIDLSKAYYTLARPDDAEETLRSAVEIAMDRGYKRYLREIGVTAQEFHFKKERLGLP